MDDAIRTDLQRLIRTVTAPAFQRRWAYYQGWHPRIYATPKLESVFRDLTDSLVENYCALAAQTRVDRLQVEGFDDEAATEIWDRSKAPHAQDRLYRWALVHARSYIIVDGVEETLSFNPATVAAAFPDDDDPDLLAYGGKVWEPERGKARAVLYYPDTTLRLKQTDGDWQVVEDLGQPLGAVPMVEVRPYGDGPPMLDLIAPVQDRINKTNANSMVAAEFGAFKQRVFFTRQDVDAYDVRNAPDHAIVLDPGDQGEARMQETTATDLRNYDDSKSQAIDALFTIAQLPRHLRVNPGSPPSGDAIKADEGPLVQAVREHQREIGEAISDALRLLDVEAAPVWRDPEVNDDLANAQTVATLVGAGVPWQTAVQVAAGWTPEMVADAEAVQAQAVTQANAAGAALLQAYNVAAPEPVE